MIAMRWGVELAGYLAMGTGVRCYVRPRERKLNGRFVVG